MKRFIRHLAIVAAVFAPLMTSMAPTAKAASVDVFEITGGGSISPGLTATGTPQTFNFSGDGTNVGTDGVAVATHCDAAGSDSVGSIVIGVTVETVTCITGTKVFVLVCIDVRVGPVWIIICADASIQYGGFVCAFDPGQLTPPVTSYTLACTAGYVKVP